MLLIVVGSFRDLTFFAGHHCEHGDRYFSGAALEEGTRRADDPECAEEYGAAGRQRRDGTGGGARAG